MPNNNQPIKTRDCLSYLVINSYNNIFLRRTGLVNSILNMGNLRPRKAATVHREVFTSERVSS